jgi:hypothetical protein
LTSSPDALGVLAGARPAARPRPGAAAPQQRILDAERSDAAGSRAALVVAVDRDPGELCELARPLARRDGQSPAALARVDGRGRDRPAAVDITAELIAWST